MNSYPCMIPGCIRKANIAGTGRLIVQGDNSSSTIVLESRSGKMYLCALHRDTRVKEGDVYVSLD